MQYLYQDIQIHIIKYFSSSVSLSSPIIIRIPPTTIWRNGLLPPWWSFRWMFYKEDLRSVSSPHGTLSCQFRECSCFVFQGPQKSQISWRLTVNHIEGPIETSDTGWRHFARRYFSKLQFLWGSPSQWHVWGPSQMWAPWCFPRGRRLRWGAWDIPSWGGLVWQRKTI